MIKYHVFDHLPNIQKNGLMLKVCLHNESKTIGSTGHALT